LIVDADNPALPSEIRTTFSAPRRGRCCTATNSNTSRGVTAAGSFATIEKKTAKSCAYARTVFGRTLPCAKSKNSSTRSWPTRHDRPPSARVTH
jgi:hypothetical protein